MNTLLALALSFNCTGFGLIEVGIQGKVENAQPESVMVWLTDVAFPVEESHIEKFEQSDDSLLIHIRDPENSDEFFQLETLGSAGRVTFDYHGVRMTDQKVYCTFQ